MPQITIHCPECQRAYVVDAQMAGQLVKCQACSAEFQAYVQLSDSSPGKPAPRFLPVDNPNPSETLADPLAPLPDLDSLPAELPSPAPGAPRSAIRQPPATKTRSNSIAAGFGSIEKSCLCLGAFLLLLGIVLNLLPLFGMQVARFQGDGTLGQAAGLILGLLGAGLLAFGLRRVQVASLISGIVGAAFVFIVFMASVLGGARTDGQDETPVVEKTDEETERFVMDTTRLSSPWIATYPKWEGFVETELTTPSPADNWRRIAMPDLNISARFLGQPATGKSQLRVNRRNVDVTEITASVQGQKFLLAVFRYPISPRQSDSQILDDVESAIGEFERTESVIVSDYPGRTYKVISAARSLHGCFVLMDDLIVHIRVSGPSSRVPGQVSEKFVNSLRLGEENLTEQRPAPDVKLNDQQTARNEAILGNVRALENAMDTNIHPRCRMNFSPAYLTSSVGQDRGQRRFMAHPAKLPVIGVDVIEVNTNAGKIIANVAPIYESATDSQSIMAREGYGLAAINVNAYLWMEGVQFVFMEITPMGFNTGKSYTTKWYGTPASGASERLGGNGRPVYGLWMYRSRFVKSLGLIRERN
ncbi:MAG: MJ0042-type zinc finger domain-containing protein [Pirellulaceae bacterium]